MPMSAEEPSYSSVDSKTISSATKSVASNPIFVTALPNGDSMDGQFPIRQPSHPSVTQKQSWRASHRTPLNTGYAPFQRTRCPRGL